MKEPNLKKSGQLGIASVVIVCLFLLAINAKPAFSIFSDPAITYIENSSRTDAVGTDNRTGGAIYTINLDTTNQDTNWKAYVGNVTGGLTLEDSSGFKIYDWSYMSIAGEVYATRKTTAPTWASLNCSWMGTIDGTGFANYTNQSIEIQEGDKLTHTRTSIDTINATYINRSHPILNIGATVTIPANTCNSVIPYVNSISPTSASFENVVLIDGANFSVGSVVYATFIESNAAGYNNGAYDFQLMVPSNATVSAPAVPYYFYVELT